MSKYINKILQEAPWAIDNIDKLSLDQIKIAIKTDPSVLADKAVVAKLVWFALKCDKNATLQLIKDNRLTIINNDNPVLDENSNEIFIKTLETSKQYSREEFADLCDKIFFEGATAPNDLSATQMSFVTKLLNHDEYCKNRNDFIEGCFPRTRGGLRKIILDSSSDVDLCGSVDFQEAAKELSKLL